MNAPKLLANLKPIFASRLTANVYLEDDQEKRKLPCVILSAPSEEPREDMPNGFSDVDFEAVVLTNNRNKLAHNNLTNQVTNILIDDSLLGSLNISEGDDLRPAKGIHCHFVSYPVSAYEALDNAQETTLEASFVCVAKD